MYVVRTLLLESLVTSMLWAETLQLATHLINRHPKSYIWSLLISACLLSNLAIITFVHLIAYVFFFNLSPH